MKAFTMASFVVFGKPSHNIKKQIHVHGFPRNAASHQTYLNSTNALFTMEPKETLEHLKESNTFRQWNEKNTDNFFSYALKIIENKSEEPWKLGFYLKSKDKMVSFIIKSDNIEMQNEEEIFKRPETEVKPIKEEKIKVPFKRILKNAEQLQKEKYSKEIISKTIAILQNLKEYGTVWNITFVTLAFKTLNLKINSENGEIIDYNLESLMSLMRE